MTEFLRRGNPGMKSVKDMPVVQDGPPPGGFPSVRFARRVPSTGPSGLTLFAVTGFIMGWGLYKAGQGNKERRMVKAEKLEARQALLPFLQAEEDRRFVKAYSSFQQRQADVMKDVPGFNAEESVYKTRWMPPAKPFGVWGSA